MLISLSGLLTKPEDFNQFVQRNESGVPMCGICSKFTNKSLSNVRNHIESKHYPNTFSYNCKHCQSVFGTYNSLNMHERNSHRKPSDFSLIH